MNESPVPKVRWGKSKLFSTPFDYDLHIDGDLKAWVRVEETNKFDPVTQERICTYHAWVVDGNNSAEIADKPFDSLEEARSYCFACVMLDDGT